MYEDVKVCRIVRSGYHFGNYHVFSGYASEFTYRAIELTKVLLLPKHRFLSLLNNYPDIKKHMIDYAYKMTKQTYKAMVSLIKNMKFI